MMFLSSSSLARCTTFIYLPFLVSSLGFLREDEEPQTKPSLFRVISPAEENLSTFEPSPGLFNFTDSSTSVVGTRSVFSGNIYNELTTPIGLFEPVGKVGLQPVVVPVPIDDVIGTFSSASVVTRGLPLKDFDPTNPSTKVTITQIDYSGHVCFNDKQGDVLGSVIGCLLLQYGGPFFNDVFDVNTLPTPIDADIVGGTGIFKGASGTVVNINLSGSSGSTAVLDLLIILGKDSPECNFGQILATKSPTCNIKPPKPSKAKKSGKKNGRR